VVAAVVAVAVAAEEANGSGGFRMAFRLRRVLQTSAFTATGSTPAPNGRRRKGDVVLICRPNAIIALSETYRRAVSCNTL